jgi:hypothetical protein
MEASQAEIGQLRFAEPGEQDILRFDVPMGMPARWAVSSAPASTTPIRATSLGWRHPVPSTPASESPGSSSITIQHRPSAAVPASYTVTIPGCPDSRPIAEHSR